MSREVTSQGKELGHLGLESHLHQILLIGPPNKPFFFFYIYIYYWHILLLVSGI